MIPLKEIHFGDENIEDVEAILEQSIVLWYADFVKYLTVGVLPPKLTYQYKKKFSMTLNNILGRDTLIQKGHQLSFSSLCP